MSTRAGSPPKPPLWEPRTRRRGDRERLSGGNVNPLKLHDDQVRKHLIAPAGPHGPWPRTAAKAKPASRPLCTTPA
jgi:hypothetical protein